MCFECDRIGNFSTKYPYKTNKKQDFDFRSNKNIRKKEEKIKHYKKKKNMYAIDDSNSSHEDDNISYDVLFNAINSKYELFDNEYINNEEFDY